MSYKKYVPKKARSTIRRVAKKYLKIRRSPYVKAGLKGGIPSSTAIAKTLSNFSRKLNVSAENKILDEIHTTGSPDVSLRQFYNITASALQSTISTTVTAGVSGYLLLPITPPTRGDGLTNFDGKKYSVESIQWKGTIMNRQQDLTIKMFIVEYSDEDMDAFAINEFMKLDNNGEYSTVSKRNADFKGYKVVASRTFKMSAGGTQRRDFNIIASPKKIVRHYELDDTIISSKYFILAVCSGDIADRLSLVNYMGNTRMKFIH